MGEGRLGTDDRFGLDFDQVVSGQIVDRDQGVGRLQSAENATVGCADGFGVGDVRQIDAGARDVFNRSVEGADGADNLVDDVSRLCSRVARRHDAVGPPAVAVVPETRMRSPMRRARQ